MSSEYDIYNNIIQELIKERKSNVEIGRILNIDPRRVSDILKRLGVKNKRFSELKEDIILDEEQEQFIIGGLLGDMCIFKDKNAKYHRMNCGHSIKQYKYLEYKYDKLSNIFNYPVYRSWIDKRTNNLYEEYRIQTKTHPFFTKLHNTWYISNIKIVPDYCSKINSQGLAIWYMDDGYKHISSNKYKQYLFSTNGFTVNDINNLIQILNSNFNIKSSLQKSTKQIYILSKSNIDFVDLISPYIIDEMKFKL